VEGIADTRYILKGRRGIVDTHYILMSLSSIQWVSIILAVILAEPVDLPMD